MHANILHNERINRILLEVGLIDENGKEHKKWDISKWHGRYDFCDALGNCGKIKIADNVYRPISFSDLRYSTRKIKGRRIWRKMIRVMEKNKNYGVLISY